MIDLLIELDDSSKLNPEQAERVSIIKAAFSSHFDRRKKNVNELQSSMFMFSTQRVSEFFDECVRQSGSGPEFSTLLAQVISRFTTLGYLEFLLGADVLSRFREIIALCQKRVLITLDDFDSVYDQFRRRAVTEQERRNKAKIELEFLRGLMVLVNSIKLASDAVYLCLGNADFCLTIPHDRFAEIERTDRDAYRYGQSAANILWSGIELCELLVLRLEKMTGYKCRKNTAREKLDEILEERWPRLPRMIRFQFNGYRVEIPLFLYVLRHTFWRPRDILRYFGSILAAAQSIEAKGEELDSETVRQIISLRTRDIIGTEFLREYECAIFSIEHVIKAFTARDQLMTFEDVTDAIGKIPFGVAVEDEAAVNMDRKVEILYEIGFLGVQLDERHRTGLLTGSESFYFNEGRAPLKAMRQSRYRCGRFVVHPIFAEYLLLDYSSNNFMLNLTWDYIVKTHSTIVASAKGW